MIRHRTTEPPSELPDRQRGASLVELALLAPFLVLVLIGVVEFAWLFSQHLDVRQGAREGARLAVVNYPEGPSAGSRSAANTDALVAEICSWMDDATDVTVDVAAQSTGSQDESVTVEVAADADTLTTFLDWAIPSDLELTSSAEGRILYAATWADTGGPQACP